MALDVSHYGGFAVLLIAIGVVLLIISIISGFTMLIAFSKNLIVIHSINDIRVNMIRVSFNFIIPFIGGILLVLAGATINAFASQQAYRHMQAAERNRQEKSKEHMLNMVLNEDEKKILDIVKSYPKGILQSDLVIKTGYSKVKVHRVLKKLEFNELIRRGRSGITNKVFANE
ncbi:MAG: hypothetical protein QXW10_01450 [Candidatus Micrarchaeaceae archaeon]